MVLSAFFAVVDLSLITPNIQASSGGALEELGDMLGIDSDDDGDEASNSDSTGQTESTLAVPNITQRDEPPVSAASGSVISTDEFAMNAEFEPHEFIPSAKYWQMDAFGFNLTPNSSICQTGNCEFEFEDGELNSDYKDDWVLTGRLKVGVETDEGIRSTLYDVRAELDREETLETDDTVTDTLGGEFRLGSGSVIRQQEIDAEYEVTDGTLTIEDEDASLILRGTKR